MHARWQAITATVVLAAAPALPLVGCGSDDDDTASTAEGVQTTATAASQDAGGGGTLRIVADPGGALAFASTELEAEAGTTTVELTNASGIPHAVEIEGNGIEEETETITDGTAEITVDLQPGTYEFYCPVGNHRAAGMEGELTVR